MIIGILKNFNIGWILHPIVNRGVHLHPISLNNAPPKALVGASLKGYSLHCIILGTATEPVME